MVAATLALVVGGRRLAECVPLDPDNLPSSR